MNDQYVVAVVRAKLAAQAARESVERARHRLDAAAETLSQARNIHARYHEMLGSTHTHPASTAVSPGRKRGWR